MALNPYFQQGARSEQSLVQSLINEQLRMYGVEVHYMPRKYLTTNTVIREVVQSKFDDAYPLEAYVDTYDGYGENPTILSKFGIEQTNEITLTISKDRWEQYIEPLMKNEPDVKLTTRPKEGDLIYFPLGDRLFEIKYVEHEKPFYQLQKTYIYELRCELFRYEDEVIDTGVAEIDDELTGDTASGETEDGTPIIIGPTQTLTLVGAGVQATAITGIRNHYIRSVTVTGRGGGYNPPVYIGFSSAPTGGVTGIGTASLIGGINVCNLNVNPRNRSVQAINLINSGSGYTVSPGVAVTGDGKGATATAGIGTTGGVGIVTLSAAGGGYVFAPTVTFSTPIHVGAAATAVLDVPMVGGGVSITSAPISIGASSYLFNGGTTGGVYYKRAPEVIFALPTGSADTATATATLDDYHTTGGTVLSIAVNEGGRFYDSSTPPTVSISHPGWSYASATIGLAGTSIDPDSISFGSTGRAYTTSPTVVIGTGSGTDTPLEYAVGIATINPITGVVTAVSFDVADPWAVGTGATIGLGYTVTPTISFSGAPSPVNATATASIDADGQVEAISIGNSGFGYVSVPSVTVAAPTSTAEQYRALGVATIRYNSIKTEGTVGIGSTVFTGITTTNIVVGDRVRMFYDHDDVFVNYIPDDTWVTQIEPNEVYISAEATNVGIGTTTFEFGIDKCGIVTGIAVTWGGGGYLEPPIVSISNTEGDKNYIEEVAGIHTATGISTLTAAGNVADVYISDAGHGYVLTPTVTLSEPSMDSTGNFIFNEIVTGSVSNTTGRVRTWDGNTNILEVSSITGSFKLGEMIVGSTSGASHKLRIIDTEPTDDGFADNFNIENEADEILDFTEQNPFGIP
tara:strand:- start:561 stop:3125 length:2565 start_codon:yes stop_codon:yes gene_type:complete